MSARVGRPTRYNASIASIICRQLIEGQSLRTICKHEGMPGRRTAYDWRNAPSHTIYASSRLAP
jgi:hypothetical protein